jgi:hypothetical protein
MEARREPVIVAASGLSAEGSTIVARRGDRTLTAAAREAFSAMPG